VGIYDGDRVDCEGVIRFVFIVIAYQLLVLSQIGQISSRCTQDPIQLASIFGSFSYPQSQVSQNSYSFGGPEQGAILQDVALLPLTFTHRRIVVLALTVGQCVAPFWTPSKMLAEWHWQTVLRRSIATWSLSGYLPQIFLTITSPI